MITFLVLLGGGGGGGGEREREREKERERERESGVVSARIKTFMTTFCG